MTKRRTSSAVVCGLLLRLPALSFRFEVVVKDWGQQTTGLQGSPEALAPTCLTRD